MTEIKHSVQYFSGIGTIIGVAAFILISIIGLSRTWGNGDVYQYIYLIGVLLGLAVLIYVLYSRLKKPTEIELYLYNDHVLLDGHTIQAGEIRTIMIRGYFRPVIGILPYGKKIVPMKKAFRFSKEEDKGISDLNKWAERNHIKLIRKSFTTWL